MHRVNYLESLCGLLHDVGKPFQRYYKRTEDQRVGEALEERDENILNLIPKGATHEEIGIEVVKHIAGMRIDQSLCMYFFGKVLKHADYIAAAERGLSEEYSYLSDYWSEIERKVSMETGLRYGYIYTPLLSPLWIPALAGYTESIGPCANKPFIADEALKKLVNQYESLLESLQSRDIDKISRAIANMINKLKDMPLWLPPRPLTRDNIEKLKTLNYLEAQRETDYLGISRYLIKGIKSLTNTYGTEITRGYIDTLNEMLKYTLLTVPAAVFMAFPPDTNLYSHSKAVAAYASALSLKAGEEFRLLIVDARRIQDFVASPVVAKAASRVIRGRSFLVELISMSLLNYVLELYGGLPYTNVLTSEGGTISIIVPSLGSENHIKILSRVRDVVESTYRRIRGLGFTIAISGSFGLKEANFIENIKSRIESNDRKQVVFLDVLEELEKILAHEKVVDDTRLRLNIDETEIIGFDAITREPVTRDEVTTGYGLRIDEGVLEYAKAISGGKLETEDVISEATHLSLVAGSGIRNMVLLLSFYLYKSDFTNQEEVITPASDEIGEFINELRKHVSHRTRREVKDFELAFRISYSGHEFIISLIPLPSLGSIHVMIASVLPAPTSEPSTKIREDLIDNAVKLVTEIIESIVERLRSMKYPRVELRIVNTGIEFIDILNSVTLQSTIRKLISNKIDFHLGTIHTGTYHPYTLSVDREGAKHPVLVDLDAYNLIAMVKADADNLGEIKKLVSFSPTRLTALSDMLTAIITYKTHLLALNYVSKTMEKIEPRGPIILYAGGDDLAIYGYWVDVLLFLDKLYEEVFTALYPLSFTSSMAIERNDYPLLELYSIITSGLSNGKRDARGWIFIADISTPRIVKCPGRVKVTTGVLPIQIGVYSSTQLCTPLEVFHSLARLIQELEEKQEFLSKITNYKRELTMISRLAAIGDKELEVFKELLMNKQPSDIAAFFNITRRLIALSYASARREKDVKEISNLIGQIIQANSPTRIYHQSGESVIEAFNRVLCSKTFLDILLLYLHPHSREIRRSQY